MLISSVDLWTFSLQSDRVVHWLVLDGPIQPALNNALCHLIAEEGMTLGNGETLSLPPFCKIIIETLTLDHCTPSLTWSSVVHCSRATVSSCALVDTWLDRAYSQYNLSAAWYECVLVLHNYMLST